jgi:hypothetical protein
MSAEIFLLPVYWLATPVTGRGGDGRKERSRKKETKGRESQK